MSQSLDNLLFLLRPEKLEEGLFRGQNEDFGLDRVFGGQVVGQAIYAAGQTVPGKLTIHSLHCYFLRPGDNKKPIIFQVEVLRDGKTFSTRRTCAIQNGLPIFYMTASFQRAEHGFEHQKTMPQVTSPDELPDEKSMLGQLAHLLPEAKYDRFLAERPFEVRPVNFYHPFGGYTGEPCRNIWFRANGKVPRNEYMHLSLLGYISDYNLLPVVLQPHGKGFLEPDIQIATIDHAMWIHRPFDINDWLLYSIESTSASGARGYVRGEFYTQNGTLVASVTQEGVVRCISVKSG